MALSLSLQIVCLFFTSHCFGQKKGEWTWMSGTKYVNTYGLYGVQGVPSPNNVPGSRCPDHRSKYNLVIE